MKTVVMSMLLLMITACSSQESAYDYEDNSQVESEQAWDQEVNQKSEHREQRRTDGGKYYYQTLCGELSADNSDCRQAAKDVCKDREVKIHKVLSQQSCQKKINGVAYSAECKKVLFTCE